MTDTVTIDIRMQSDIEQAERDALDYLKAGRRLVLITNRNGERKLTLLAVPLGADTLAIHGDGAAVTKTPTQQEAVSLGLRNARWTFDGYHNYSDSGRRRERC